MPNLASSEQGLADFEAPTWFAVFLPRGASEPIFRKLNQAAFATADMSYGSDLVELVRLAATYVDRILRGATPHDLPVQSSTSSSW